MRLKRSFCLILPFLLFVSFACAIMIRLSWMRCSLLGNEHCKAIRACHQPGFVWKRSDGTWRTNIVSIIFSVNCAFLFGCFIFLFSNLFLQYYFSLTAQECPSDITLMITLKEFKMTQCRFLSKFPVNIVKLNRLRQLVFDDCSITDIPNDIVCERMQ
jgi:hypothetical protein